VLHLIRRTALVAIAAGSLATLPASSASAAGWAPPVSLAGIGISIEPASVAIDPSGDAVAVWQGGGHAIEASFAPAGSTWQAPTVLTEPGISASYVHVAFDDAGDAIAIWQSWDGKDELIQGAVRPSGSTWGAPTDLSLPSQHASSPELAVNASGDAAAVWEADLSAKSRIQAALKPAGGAWEAPDFISGEDFNASRPDVAIDAQGNVVAVWETQSKAEEMVQGAFKSAASAWQVPEDLSPEKIGYGAREPQVAMDSGGNAMAVWTRATAFVSDVESSARPVNGPWASPQELSHSEAYKEAYGPEISMNAGYGASVVWRLSEPGSESVQIISQDINRSWHLAQPIEEATSPQVSAIRQRGPLVVWQGGDGIHGSFEAPFLLKPKVFDLSTPEVEAQAPQVATNADGEAVVAWRLDTGPEWALQVTTYRGTRPELLDLSVPGRGTVGKATPFSVAPAGMWRPAGGWAAGTAWSFGDGNTAAGTRVTHTYRTPGTYTVTVSTTDAAGAMSRATRQIIISKPPSTHGVRATIRRLGRVVGSTVSVRLSCKGARKCSGVLKIIGPNPARRHGKWVYFGAKSFSVEAGKAKTIRIKLISGAIHALREASRHRLRVQIYGRGVASRTMILSGGHNI